MNKPIFLTPAMKRLVLPACLLSLVGSLHATVYTPQFVSGFANAGVVPDGNVTGWSDIRIVTGIAESPILDLNVWLNFTGGWNGDLYAYLTHDTGFSVLLNRAGRTASDGFGYSDAGMSIVLDDHASLGDIHAYQIVPGYSSLIAGGHSWRPDARDADPAAVTDTMPRTSWLRGFNGLNPNGAWNLFVADLSIGDVSKIEGWGLEITTAGEPAPVPDTGRTATGLALGFLGLWCARRWLGQAAPRTV